MLKHAIALLVLRRLEIGQTFGTGKMAVQVVETAIFRVDNNDVLDF